jgi:hypothetical protein
MGVKLVSHIKGRPQSGKKVLRRMLGRGGGGGGKETGGCRKLRNEDLRTLYCSRYTRWPKSQLTESILDAFLSVS